MSFHHLIAMLPDLDHRESRAIRSAQNRPWEGYGAHTVAEVRMAEGIPKSFSEAFKQAIVVCRNWSGDDRAPPLVGVAWDPNQNPDPQHPEMLCNVVINFSDEMPSDVVASLLRLPYNVADSVAIDQTYANGALCLLDFIKLKREMYNRSL